MTFTDFEIVETTEYFGSLDAISVSAVMNGEKVSVVLSGNKAILCSLDCIDDGYDELISAAKEFLRKKV